MTVDFLLSLLAVFVICGIIVFPFWVVCKIGMSKILQNISPYKPDVPRGTGKRFRRKGR